MAMSRRKFLQVCGLGLTTVAAGSLVGCGGSDNSAATTAAAGGDVANKDKPSSSSTASRPTAPPVSST